MFVIFIRLFLSWSLCYFSVLEEASIASRPFGPPTRFSPFWSLPGHTHIQPRTKQKLGLQRGAIECLSTVISRAGAETTGMLVAHRVPAILCCCLRRQQRKSFPTAAPPDSSSGSRAGGRDPAAPACSSVLAVPAARALAQLVHPTGSQWRPLRALPFGEAATTTAAASQHRRPKLGRHRRDSSPRSVPMVEPSSTRAGMAVDVTAAVELAASVWGQTAKHLLERAEGGGGGGGGYHEHGANLEAATAAEEGSQGVSAVAALCTILCEAGKIAGCSDDAAGSRADSGERDIAVSAIAAPFHGQLRRSFEKGSNGEGVADATRLAALRVLLHACRASSGVAHAIVAFGGGAAVQVLLGQLSRPSASGPYVSTCA